MTRPPVHIRTGETPPAAAHRAAGPCTVVILGAGGDLAKRKLIPSLLHLLGDGLLHEATHVAGVGRSPMSDEAFGGNTSPSSASFIAATKIAVPSSSRSTT